MDSIEKSLLEAQEAISAMKTQAEREADYAVIANKRFEENLATFQKYYPDIAEALANFQAPEDFHLLVTTSGEGNMLDPKSGIPLYSDDPIKQTEEQIAKAIKKPFITHTNYAGFAGLKKDQEFLHGTFMRKLGQTIKEAKSSEYIKELPERMPSALIFGLGLGYHLELLTEKYQFDYLFICEPQIEMLFASLFCIDWKTIIERIDEQKGCLFIHVGVTYKEFFKDLWNVSENIGAFSIIKSFCYQHYPSLALSELIIDFQKRYFELQMGFGFYNDARSSVAHTILNTEKSNNYIKNRKAVENPYKDIPIYIIGNGPSLDLAETFLKENQGKAIILAAGSALNSLERMGITPDFHVLVERPKVTFDVLLHFLPKEYYKNINLLTLNVMYPDVLDLYKWSGIALKPSEAGSALHCIARALGKEKPLAHLAYCNPLVSNTAFSYAISMGFENIYLFGVDNGTPIDGEHHSKHSFYYDKKMQQSKNVKKHKFDAKLPGNFGGTVQSNKLLTMSNVQFERFLVTENNHNLQCFNVGDGAKIEGAYSTHLNDLLAPVNIIDKTKIIKSIKEDIFYQTSVDNIDSTIDIEMFEKVCLHIIDINDENVYTREEALDALRRQSRYLYAFRESRFGYIHFIVEGSLLYFHCPMVTALYSYNDSEDGVHLYNQLSIIWSEYLRAIIDDFKVNYRKKCDKKWAFKPD